MNPEYRQQRQDARYQHMRTVDDGTKVSFSLSDGQLFIDTPPRLDYLVTPPAIREAQSLKGTIRSLEVRMHETHYIDSAGISLLLVLQSLVTQRNRRPRLSGVIRSEVKLPFTYTNLGRVFEM